MIAYETDLGSVNISNDFFSKLIGRAASSCYGVTGMVPKGATQMILGKFRKGRLNTGVIVKGTIESIVVDLHISVLYGMNINSISQSITNKIQYVVKETTGIDVSKVNVHIDGIKE